MGRLQVQISCLVDVLLVHLALRLLNLSFVVSLIEFFLANLVADSEIVERLHALASLDGHLEVLHCVHEVLVVVEVQGSEVVLSQLAILIRRLLVKLSRLLDPDVRQLVKLSSSDVLDPSSLVDVAELSEGLVVVGLGRLPEQLQGVHIDLAVTRQVLR